MDSSNYNEKHLYRDITAGGIRGGILGFCFGLIMGAYNTYDSKTSNKIFFKKWAGFTARSTIAFVPILGVSSVSYRYCKANKMEEWTSMIVTILFTGIMFEYGKRFIH